MAQAIAIAKKAAKDMKMGCNMVYVTKSKYQ
jgi:hypothetical protein